MWFELDNATLDVLMAVCAAVCGAGLPAWLVGRFGAPHPSDPGRRRSGAWSLVLPGSIVVCVVAIGLVPASADAYAWLALIGVPLGCALALGWAMHGARPWLAVLTVPLFVLAVDDVDIARDLLIAGSAVTLGRLIAGSAPLTLIKIGLVAMAVVDAVLVFSGNLQEANASLIAAQPAEGLPQLQSGALGDSSLGYGDFLAAAVLGGILAAERAPQLAWALALLVAHLLWNQLFLVTNSIPATVPAAVVLIVREIGLNRRR